MLYAYDDGQLPASGCFQALMPACGVLPDIMQELALLKRLPLLPLRDTRYLWRRALRILPAFYSALAIVRLLVVPLARHPSVPEEVRRTPAKVFSTFLRFVVTEGTMYHVCAGPGAACIGRTTTFS